MRYSFILLTGIIFLLSQCNSTTNVGYLQVDVKDTSLSKKIIKLTQNIEEEPNNDEYFQLRANEWVKSNNIQNALSDISYALELNNTNAIYNFKKAEYLMALDSVDVQQAMTLYKTATEIEPNFEDAHFKLGKIYLARQEYENALASFDKLIEIDLNNAKAYFWEGIAYKENKFLDKAEEMFFKAVEVDNTYYDAYMQLGDLYAKKDQKNALDFYANALKIRSNSDEAFYAMGRIFQSQNKFKDAYKYYNQAVLSNSGHKFASYSKAFIDAKFENYDAAIKTLDNILNMAPDYSNALTLRGYILEQQKEIDLAKKDYAAALAINPQDSVAKKSLELLQ